MNGADGTGLALPMCAVLECVTVSFGICRYQEWQDEGLPDPWAQLDDLPL